MASLDEVFIGATRKNIRLTIPDKNSTTVPLPPLPITGATVLMLGKSDDLPGLTISVAGTILDGPNGVVQWTAVGKDDVVSGPATPWVSTAAMSGRTRATVRLQWKLTDSAGNVDFGPVFDVDWRTPIG